MSLETQLAEKMKATMKAKDPKKLEILRSIKAAFQNLNSSEDFIGKEITEEIRMKELQKMVKQRNDAANIFIKNNRTELHEKEIYQISIIEEFLPQKMTAEEIEAEIKSTIKETGVTDIKQMGLIIGTVTKKLIGKADGKTISEITKKLLS